MSNPLLGILFHWIGGLAAGSFYAPYRMVRSWAWETYWLAGGIFSWIVAPWVFCFLLLPDPIAVLNAVHLSELGWPYMFGVLWGVGGLTFGLTMRYLGMSLGMALALGYCAAFGALMPPIVDGSFVPEVLGTTSGRTVLIGIAVCIIGIAVAGVAGISKERELDEEAKQAAVKEFNFKKGFVFATISGVMSSCFAFGLAAGEAIKREAVAQGASLLWQGLPVLVVVLFGGFTTNAIWCVALNIRNKTGGQYFSRSERTPRFEIAELAAEREASAIEAFLCDPEGSEQEGGRVPLVANWLFAALAGTIWYFQFFFYSMGESQMGAYGFSSWTMHMASIIIFSTLWGVALKEWKGTSGQTQLLLIASLALLVLSTVIVGYGNFLAGGQASY